MKYLQIKLPDDLHWQFKKKCFEDKTDMSTQVRKWVKDYVKGD